MRILVIDADAASRSSTVRFLEKTFDEVEFVEAGDFAGLDRVLEQGQADLVITEHALGPLSGLSLLEHLQERLPQAPAVVFTGFNDADAAVTALRSGASDYVLKVYPERLLAALYVALASSRTPLNYGNASSDAGSANAAEPAPGSGPIGDDRGVQQGQDQGGPGTITQVLPPHSFEQTLMWQAAILREQALLLDLTNDAVMVRDLNATILFWNHGAELRYGWSKQEALGHRSHTLLHTEFPEPVTDVYAKLLRNGYWAGELVHTRRDGSQIVVDSHWALKRDDQGEPLSVLEINSDITERKRAEQALSESEARYRQMFEKNRSIKLLIDPQTGDIVQANPAACDYYGYSLDQLQGMKIGQISLLPESELRDKMARVMDGRDTTIVFRQRKASGEVRDVEVSASPIELGERNLIYSIVHDITERKHAEDALWQHTKRLQILHDIDQSILALKPRREIAQSALRFLRQVVPARYGSVLLFDFAAGQAEALAVDASGPLPLTAGERMPLDSPWSSGDQERNNVYLIDDLQDGADGSPAMQALRTAGMRAHLSVPLNVQGQLIGRLNLGSGKAGAFALQHFDIARQVADSLAVAIQNARLYEGEQRARQTAETLRAANLALTQSLDLDSVFTTLLDYMHRLVAYDSASVMLLVDHEWVVVRAVAGYDRWVAPEQLRELEGLTFEIDATPSIAAVLRDQQSLLIEDRTAFPGWQPGPGSEHIRNWLGVPLIAQGRCIGLCSLDKAEAGFFTDAHVQLAAALAAQAAVAILNARLFEEVRKGREQLQTLSRRLVDVQETERRHVARELHDEAGQALTSLMVSLGLLEREAQCAEPVVAQLEELKHRVDGILEDLHGLAVNLRPAALDHLGLVPALRQYVGTIHEQTGLKVEFESFNLDGERLTPDVETSLYRIVQEALTNVIRHAHASQAGVLIERRGDRMIAIIEDNGIGFDAESAMRSGRLGLVGMRERAEMLGGALAVESTPKSGTSVFVDIPYIPISATGIDGEHD